MSISFGQLVHAQIVSMPGDMGKEVHLEMAVGMDNGAIDIEAVNL